MQNGTIPISNNTANANPNSVNSYNVFSFVTNYFSPRSKTELQVPKAEPIVNEPPIPSNEKDKSEPIVSEPTQNSVNEQATSTKTDNRQDKDDNNYDDKYQLNFGQRSPINLLPAQLDDLYDFSFISGKDPYTNRKNKMEKAQKEKPASFKPQFQAKQIASELSDELVYGNQQKETESINSLREALALESSRVQMLKEKEEDQVYIIKKLQESNEKTQIELLKSQKKEEQAQKKLLEVSHERDNALSERDDALSELEDKEKEIVALKDSSEKTEIELKTELNSLKEALAAKSFEAQALETKVRDQGVANGLLKEHMQKIETKASEAFRERDEALQTLAQKRGELETLVLEQAHTSTQQQNETSKQNDKLTAQLYTSNQKCDELIGKYNELDGYKEIQDNLIKLLQEDQAKAKQQLSDMQSNYRKEKSQEKQTIFDLKNKNKALIGSIAVVLGLTALAAGNVLCPALLPVTIMAIKVSLPFLIAGATVAAAGLATIAYATYRKCAVFFDKKENNGFSNGLNTSAQVAPI